ncbi:MAG: cupin domain-containing protein, partial [Deltaproteobacteria bacterium]
SKPGKWRCIFTESEFCHILSGVLIVTGDDGQTATYRAGDAFLSPAGFTGTWEVVETVRKEFAFYE